MTQKIKSQESTYQNPESIGNSEVLDINKMKFLTAMLVGAVLQTTLLDSPGFTQKFTRYALGWIKLDQIGSDRIR